MEIYLKGYYGYQNFGDELLLLGVIDWLAEYHPYTTLYIETKNTERLTNRLQRSKKSVKTDIDNIVCVSNTQQYIYAAALKVFGGGEVVSDARSFPWNGWNYLIGFFGDIMKRNFLILGGIGTEKKIGTTVLYKHLLGRAKEIVTRDATSCSIAEKYSNHVINYHDFAYDVLDHIVLSSPPEKPYIIINVNRYLRNDTVIDTIRQTVKLYPDHDIYFFPAAWGSDDLLFPQVREIVPHIRMYDWREYTLEESISYIAHADHVLAARLHILLVAQYYKVGFTPFVYQEKIEKVILAGTTVS